VVGGGVNMLKDRKAFLILLAIMITVAVTVAGVSASVLYRTALEQQRSRLVEVVQSQARLLEAIARFNMARSNKFPGGAAEATLWQMKDAHSRYEGFGDTGEFTLARRDGNFIEFLLSHRHLDLHDPKPVQFTASLAEPMRRALLGQSGTVIAVDYRGVMVLAAYEPVADLELGIVAKIDMAEIRAPFVGAVVIAAAIGLVLILVGSLIFFRVGNPMVQRLVRREERFSLAMKGANDGLWDWDLKTDEIYYSPRWSEIMGYESGELPSTKETWETLLHPDDRPLVDKFLTNCLEAEAKSSEVEFRFRHKAGHDVNILARGFAVRDDDGNPIRLIGTHSDISGRKQAEAALLESEEKFRAMIENTTDIIAVFNKDGFYTYISPSINRVSGMEAKAFMGLNYCDIVHPDDIDKFKQVFHRAWRHPGETIFIPEYRAVFSDGRVVFYEALLTALPNVPGIEGVVVNVREMGTRKKAETDLLIAKNEAEAASEAKSQFLSSMSHELRTPMNAILGFSQLLEHDSVEPLSERHKGFVDEILRSGRHMLDLIGDVLDLAKIESGDISLDMESEDPGPMIELCLNMVGASADQKGVVMQQGHFPEGKLPLVKVDALRFKQALLNMLSNAVKYNESGGEVVLECSSGANGILHISVSDTGPGIPDELHDKVFEPFDRLGAESSSTPGTGIGLTVTKQLIESMGGTVGFESTVGEGTTFWINLPVTQADTEPAS